MWTSVRPLGIQNCRVGAKIKHFAMGDSLIVKCRQRPRSDSSEFGSSRQLTRCTTQDRPDDESGNVCGSRVCPVNVLEAPGDGDGRHSALCEVPDACWLKRLRQLSTVAFSLGRATFVLAAAVQTNVQSPWRQRGLFAHSSSATLHTSDGLDAHFPLERAKPSDRRAIYPSGATRLAVD